MVTLVGRSGQCHWWGTAALLINDDDEPSNKRTVFSEKSQLIVTEKRSDNTV